MSNYYFYTYKFKLPRKVVVEERETNCKDGVDKHEVQHQEAQNSELDRNNENSDSNTNSEDNSFPGAITQGTFQTITTTFIRIIFV